MSSEVLITLLISFASLAFGIYSGSSAIKRERRAEERKDASELTMVIVKLEDISVGISEIKSDVSNVKGDIRELTERLIVAEQQIRQANDRIDQIHTRRNI
ncbi:MAG: hypothetical protein E7653_05800 [Ruminococcaceae bacterium]|nr:hypothetical protein [Oscillospiraceae bacterium]